MTEVDSTGTPLPGSSAKISGESTLPAPVPSMPAANTATGTGTADKRLTGVQAIAVGSNHSCALLSGDVKCWGANSVGELGDGTTLTATRR